MYAVCNKIVLKNFPQEIQIQVLNYVCKIQNQKPGLAGARRPKFEKEKILIFGPVHINFRTKSN